MLDSRSTSEHSKPYYPYAIVPYFFTKISPSRNLLFHWSDNECRFYLWYSIYTRQRGKLCILHDHTLTASFSCSFSFYLAQNNVPVLATAVWIRVWTFVYGGDLFKVIVPKVMVKIGIRFRSTVCYLIRSKLISRISGGKKCKKWMLQYLFLIIIFFEFSEDVRILYPFHFPI